ncbi:MAG TPA: tRNA (adenosine(37)-N6)-threonylcarbamoyltransferase complex transferase subunit TsaD, partial [Burkholderiaceae bacterium]|nr:tRNA (adenosine(37)-N6)-threonylcarbamoyltransferase complex transferase subunit TsaD [Burkholderiaceae bacterium]
LPRPLLHSGDLNFSFSGLKTAVLTAVRRAGNLCERTRADIAHAFVEAVVDVLEAKSMAALESTGLPTLVVAGGVGANRQLRERLKSEAQARGCALYFPPAELCTDNGAMVAMAGLARLRSGGGAQPALGFEVKPRWPLA